MFDTAKIMKFAEQSAPPGRPNPPGGTRCNLMTLLFWDNCLYRLSFVLNNLARLPSSRDAGRFFQDINIQKNIMFINLTNHPSSKWGEEQLKAAAEYGNIVDIPFPQVSPDADRLEVSRIATETIDKIREHVTLYDQLPLDAELDRSHALHIMGEMTLVYKVVSRISDIFPGVVVASTTERISVDNPDGTKTSRFRFVRFRPY